MNAWFRPLALLYLQAAELKNFLYNRNLLPSVRVPAKVISIGNLTVGGTGKTPVVRYFINFYLKQNKSVAVIAKAYRASASKPVQVDVNQEKAALVFGDEATMLAAQFPEVAVYVGQNKSEICQFAAQQKKFDVILVDDGFQHRALARDLDVVLLDASEAFDAYEVLPAGRGREPWTSLSRASIIMITKTNLAPSEKISELIRRIPHDKRTFLVNYKSSPPQNLFAPEISWDESKTSVWLVSALAKPFAFQRLLEINGFQVLGHSQFRDHHPYTQENIEKVLQFAGDVPILTTEKDAVKLKLLNLQTTNIWVVPLEIQMNSGENEIHEILSQVFAH